MFFKQAPTNDFENSCLKDPTRSRGIDPPWKTKSERMQALDLKIHKNGTLPQALPLENPQNVRTTPLKNTFEDTTRVSAF